ncbi:hypothetical protein HDU78_001285 [Chytriomyces hyalinus]|nr:hypothetical protein HDU78_001285 [Chytriomyces hyalinus]KAJ3262205.1 hypothetical protein HDU77_000425 [Chytriomyces hyalinus]
MPIVTQIYVKANGKKTESIRIRPNHTVKEVKSVLCAAAEISDKGNAHTDAILKLYNVRNALVPIGPNIPKNTPEEPYTVVIKMVPKATIDPPVETKKLMETIRATTEVMEEVPKLRSDMAEIQKKLVSAVSAAAHASPSVSPLAAAESTTKKPYSDPTAHLAMLRASVYDEETTNLILATPRPVFSSTVLNHLKHPTFNIWDYNEVELIGLMENMFVEMDLVDTFKMDMDVVRAFLARVSVTYNQNPFHNFKHCFCVTQMMYGIINVTGVITKLTPLEKLALICGTIGHDLDHPGMNNAYQINANTDLTIIYNDISPLENHHAAVLFTLFRDPSLNILATLPEVQYRECRKQIISCILATDMAKHGEILAKFKGYSTDFNFEDQAQRQLLLQMIIKCSDISNEVRPKHVSEPWVDNLLEEFFCQSDKEKRDGLPTAPFMDREKVTKPSAQVGFIGFVMIPLFELVAKVLPNMEEPIIQPIKKAHEYYKSMLETKPAA